MVAGCLAGSSLPLIHFASPTVGQPYSNCGSTQWSKTSGRKYSELFLMPPPLHALPFASRFISSTLATGGWPSTRKGISVTTPYPNCAEKRHDVNFTSHTISL